MTVTGPSSPALAGGATTLPEGLVGFHDERATCDKVHYAQEKVLGWFVVRELPGDVPADLWTPLLDAANMKLARGPFECCTLRSEDECERERLEAGSGRRRIPDRAGSITTESGIRHPRDRTSPDGEGGGIERPRSRDRVSR
jgi:hypothetical protein